MRRRQKRKEPENQERWLITYSDLITLLMIFFVIMFAMSKIDVAKFQTLAMSLQSAMSSKQNTLQMKPGDTSLLEAANATNKGNQQQTGQDANQAKKQQKLDDLYKQMQAYINSHNLQNNVQVADQNRGVQITLRDVVLFDTGQAVIKPEAVHLLAGLVPFFAEVPNNPIVVEGYTDNTPINTAQFPSNWELSSARAMNVVHFLADQKIPGERLSGVGYGEFHAVAANDTEAHKQMNRRVNIVILRTAADAGVVAPGNTPPTALINQVSTSSNTTGK